MSCPTGGTMPALSVETAEALLSGLAPVRRDDVAWESLKWLCAEHNDLLVYTDKGSPDNPYDEWERSRVAVETSVVAGQPCPFMKPDGCLVCGEEPCYKQADEFNRQLYGWLPLLVCLSVNKSQVSRLSRLGIIPDVKLIYLTRNKAFPAQGPDGSVVVI